MTRHVLLVYVAHVYCVSERMSGKWQSYKHRFIPWLALNWSTRQIKFADAKTNLDKEKRALIQLTALLEQLDKELPRYSVKEYQMLLQDTQQLRRVFTQGRKVMKEVFGYSLELGESKIVGGGFGVLVKEGCVPPGHLVGLYPGTVYLPHEPLFFQSLRNPFIFRCADGWLIDGNHRGLSKWIYRSCVYRNLVGQSVPSDLTWLSTLPSNPVAIGQFVNNHTREIANNVEYVELSIPLDLPLSFRKFIPNTFYAVHTGPKDGRGVPMRCVALLSTAPIEAGDELYSSYITLVQGNGQV